MSKIPAPVLFILGPTASGKTALALALVDRFAGKSPIELVSVDSALVYREMNIGTAKPDQETLARYPHQLVDLIDPPGAYSAARFCTDAQAAIRAIHARGNTPLLVGGTMLYVKALMDGLSDMPAADPVIRQSLDTRLQRDGLPALYAELVNVDAVTAARLKPADTQRILRALEVFLITGKPISALQNRPNPNKVDASENRVNAGVFDGQTRTVAFNPENVNFPYPSLMIGLIPSDRAVLHQRIADRFDSMLKVGLIDEVRQLRERYELHVDMPSMRCVGYRQAWEFLDGTINRDRLQETGIIATRQLAKRQMTWLRGMPNVKSVDCLRPDLAEAVSEKVAAFLSEHYSP